MKNPLNFLSKKNPIKETYLGIFLKESEGLLLYLNWDEGKLKIIASDKFIVSEGWEKLSEDVDEILNRLETKTGQSPEKTIFFIYSHLVDPLTKEIKRNFLQKIKHLVKNLELKPLGFIECHEAIRDFLQKKEKISLTANLLEVDKSELGVFVYTTGRLIFSETVQRTDNLIADLLPVFAKIKTQTILPPRIILYNSQDLSSEASNLLTYQWSKDFFIQLPKVQIFREEQLLESFLQVFAVQMQNQQESKTPLEGQGLSQEQEIMGFVIGGEAKAKAPQPPKEEQTISQPTKLKPTRSLGAIIPSEVLRKFFAQAMNKSKNLWTLLKALPFPVLPLAGVILIFSALFSIEYFFHTANVKVFFPSQKLTKSLELTATIGSSSSQNLGLQIATEAANLSESQTATGQKTIGDKAKGSVTMLNYDSNAKTFSQGTVLQAQNLKFDLSNDVTVASASVAPDLSLQPGKSTISVVAEVIGPESNLAKGQKFQVGDFPQNQYLATNADDLSGGTKRDIQTVSADDIATVKNKIITKAKDSASSQLKNKLTKDQRLLTQLTSVDSGDISYSKDVGNEATSVEGKSKVAITYYVYDQQKLLQLLADALKDKVKPGFKINNQQTKYQVKSAKPSNDTYILDLDVQTRAGEEVKTADLLVGLRGKSVTAAQELVKNEFRANGLELEVNDPFPWLRNWLPWFKKNIKLEISYL